jgi:hypothetical protein
VPLQILLIEDNLGDVRLTKEAIRETGASFDLHVVSDGGGSDSFPESRGNYGQRASAGSYPLGLKSPHNARACGSSSHQEERQSESNPHGDPNHLQLGKRCNEQLRSSCKLLPPKAAPVV